MAENKDTSKGAGLLALFLMVVVAVSLRSLFVMLAWNFVMPELFSVKELTYLHALGLFVTVSLLFGHLVPASNSANRG